MNETVLALLCSIAIYGVSSLALPRPDNDVSSDIAEISAEMDGSDIGEDDNRNSDSEIG